jgi:muramoyltetrapeptide carboxypeptidase
MMRKARRLTSGDRIALVAPASSFERDALTQGAAEIGRLGFEPVFSEAVFERALFTAGSAATRAAEFRRAWSDPSVAALMAIRGGYGSVQLLPLLDAIGTDSPPKLFIGYSDVTALLTWLTCGQGVAAVHGPMIEGRLAAGPDHYDVASLLALFGGDSGFEIAVDTMEALRPGEARGALYGGTITQLAASLGTPFAFQPPHGCVLFLEDVNERPYRLHRLLTQLRLGGVFARARAVVFGEMKGCDEPAGITARDVIRDITEGFAGPVLAGCPSGHTSGPCWSLPLGVQVGVTARPRPALVMEESPVA